MADLKRILAIFGSVMVTCSVAHAQAATPDSCTEGRLGRIVTPTSEITQLAPLSAGVTLPVRLNRSLHAGSTKPGTAVIAVTTQRVPVGPGVYLPPHVELDGTVVESAEGDGSPAHAARLAVRFNSLRWHGQTMPVTVRALALANFTDVQATAAPVAGFADIVNPDASNWTTRQVGGDEVYRSDWLGPVCSDVMRPVGMADYYGVYSLPGVPVGGTRLPFARALDVFSSDAHGVYGLDDGVSLGFAQGAVVISSPERKLSIAGEDHLLLEVVKQP